MIGVAWDGIEEAVAVDAAGSFAGAAAALGVSTSHVSRAVARLETVVQAPLFIRTTRRLSLTDTGRELIVRFRRIIEERDAAIAEVSAGGEPRGEVRITCSTALGERFVAPIARRFAFAHEGLSVSVELSNHVVDLIGEGYDLAVRTGHLSDSRLISTRIASRRLHACAAPAYLAARGLPETVADLSRHECLAGTAATWHFRIDGEDVQHRPKGRWRCNSGTAVLDATLAGLGICQLPDFYVNPHLRAGTLVPVLETARPEDEPIWAVYPQRRHLLPKVRGLVDRLRQELPPALAATAVSSRAA